MSSFTDFFLICSATSEPHLKAIATGIQDTLREEHQIRPVAVDGFPHSQWVVLDYPGVLIHLFQEDKREYYGLEDLWNDAPRIAWSSDSHAASK